MTTNEHRKEEFCAGDMVLHSVFGLGVVRELSPRGDCMVGFVRDGQDHYLAEPEKHLQLVHEAGEAAFAFLSLREGAHYSTARLPLHLLRIDRLRVDAEGRTAGYQRPLSNYIIRGLRPFDSDLCGSIRVNRRPDGSYWIMDGQHRAFVAGESGESRVWCDIFQVDVATEAKFYRIWNRTSVKASAMQDFGASLEAGDEDALEIFRIAARNSYGIALERKLDGPSYIRSVAGLKALYYGSGARRSVPEPQKLDKALRILRAAWPSMAYATHDAMLKGIDLLLTRHWEAFNERANEKRLVARMATRDPRDLVSEALEASRKSRKTSHRCMVGILEDLYNWKLTTNYLGEKERE